MKNNNELGQFKNNYTTMENVFFLDNVEQGRNNEYDMVCHKNNTLIREYLVNGTHLVRVWEMESE